MRFGGLDCRRLVTFAASMAMLAAAGAREAHASAGCDAVNAGAFNTTVTPAMEFAVLGPLTFAPGETLSFSISRIGGGDGARFLLLDPADAELINRGGNNATEAAAHVVTTAATSLSVRIESYGATLQLATTCTPVGAGGPTDSDRLRAVQVLGTRIVAQTSGQAIAGAITSGIAGSGIGGTSGTPGGPPPPAALGGPIQGPSIQGPSFLGSGRDRGDRPANAAQTWRGPDWTAWASVSVAQAERRPDDGGFEGTQVNGLVGIGRFLNPSLIVGVLAGYEGFGYDFRSLAGRLDGEGWTGGAYLAWQITPTIRFDLAGAYSGLDYDVRAGKAQGAFEGRRWMMVSGLTGTYGAAGWVIEPSAQLISTHESQDAYRDSLGVAQPEAGFNAARASAGARFAYPIRAAGGLTLAPYAGLYADYYLSSDIPALTTAALAGIADGWSARITGGLALGLDSGAALSISGEWGGLGADHVQRSLTVRGALPF